MNALLRAPTAAASAVLPADQPAGPRVLFLHADGDWLRGSELAVLAVMRHFNANAFQTFLICGNPPFVEAAARVGTSAIHRHMPEIVVQGRDTRIEVLSWALAVRAVRDFARRQRIDLIYCNGGSTSQVGYYAGRLAGVPVLSHLHSPFHRRYALFYRFHLVDRVIFVSRAIEQAITGRQSFRARRHVVHNGVDTERFQPATMRDPAPRAQLGIPPDAVVFGQVASLIHRKGVDLLLRAFRDVHGKHPEAWLLLVGDGPGRTEFVGLAELLGVADRVVFAGDLPNPEHCYRHVIDVNVLASRSDAFPLSILEASACGLPTVGAAVDGIPESVWDGRTGFLFPAGDVPALAGRMTRLLQEPELRRALGRQARQAAVEHFSLARYTKDIEHIVREAIADRSGGRPRMAAPNPGALQRVGPT